MLPPEKSSEQSSAVGEIIEEIIPPETPVGGYVQTNIRKIAHFVEFAALGAEVAVFVILFLKKRNFVFLSFGFGILIALLDETIQVFSKRGPEITDVWLDFFGFASFAVIVYTVSALIFYIQVKRKQKF
jgi:VanZ family protein